MSAAPVMPVQMLDEPEVQAGLPPLPVPWGTSLDVAGLPVQLYSGFAMRQYARAALAAPVAPVAEQSAAVQALVTEIRGAYSMARRDQLFDDLLGLLEEPVAGWKLVPIEPTHEMCIADWDVSLSAAHTNTGVAECAWAAMLAAAPAYPGPDAAPPVDTTKTEDGWPFYELKFIMRVLGQKGGAPRTDWDTAYGMAREIFVKWHAAPADTKPAEWMPQFDATSHEQETLVLQFCAEIAGPLGKPGSPPDPVRLLEMAEALYQAERRCTVTGPSSQPTQQPLTDAECIDLLKFGDSSIAMVRAIEAAHGIKPAPKATP